MQFAFRPIGIIRGFVDHHSRRAFAGLTGTWPGQQEPEPE